MKLGEARSVIISYKHRFVFVHVPKTGGTSVREAIMPLNDSESIIAQGTKHETLESFLNRHDMEEIINFTIFGFVRNPWDRFSSLFHYLKKFSSRYPAVKYMRTVNDLALSLANEEEWLANLHSVKSQSAFFKTAPGSAFQIRIGRFETIQDDFERITRYLGLPIHLPHKNKSSNFEYRTQYNEIGTKIVRDFFVEDIERFGYSF